MSYTTHITTLFLWINIVVYIPAHNTTSNTGIQGQIRLQSQGNQSPWSCFKRFLVLDGAWLIPWASVALEPPSKITLGAGVQGNYAGSVCPFNNQTLFIPPSLNYPFKTMTMIPTINSCNSPFHIHNHPHHLYPGSWCHLHSPSQFPPTTINILKVSYHAYINWFEYGMVQQKGEACAIHSTPESRTLQKQLIEMDLKTLPHLDLNISFFLCIGLILTEILHRWKCVLFLNQYLSSLHQYGLRYCRN